MSDPFLALQRDFEAGAGDKEKKPICMNPLSILEAVMAHCRKMQERMSAQLAAAENKQKKVYCYRLLFLFPLLICSVMPLLKFASLFNLVIVTSVGMLSLNYINYIGRCWVSGDILCAHVICSVNLALLTLLRSKTGTSIWCI